jgi:hypothetical protein
MHRNLEMMQSLAKTLNQLTHNGTQFTPILTVCSGTRISFHTVTMDGKSLNILGSSDLAYMVRSGRWILMPQDIQLLQQQLSYVQEDHLYFMDLKTNGWLQVLLPEINHMVNIKLFSYSGRKYWWLKHFDKQFKSLISILDKIR